MRMMSHAPATSLEPTSPEPTSLPRGRPNPPSFEGGPPPTTATRQFGALVLAPIAPEKRAALSALLAAIDAETIATMQGRPPENAIVPFHRLRSVHYARFVVIEPGSRASGIGGERALLSFSTDYDGPEGDAGCSEAKAWQHHVDDLTAQAREGLERVLSCCEGFRPGTLAAYLGRHRRAASTFYVGSSGRSLGQIRWEAALRQRVEAILAAHDARFDAPEVVRERVVAALAAEGVAVPKFPAQPALESRVTVYLWVAVAAALGALGLLVFAAVALLHVPLGGAVLGVALGVLLVALAWVVRLRWLELTDPQFQPEYSERTHDHFRTAAAGENQFLQNPLTHLVVIKPGPLRWLLIRAVFAVLQVLATYRYNRGRLGDIPSIHFARWVMLPGRRVLFLSNFDSSWQSYLGDFIDRESSGLTAVWSNTELYPRTTWLLQAGSRDAERFLAWTRQHQLPTSVWYCAYPGLSIVNINDNTEIRRGLADRPAIDAATWLFRLRNVDRVRADQLYGDEQTRDPSLPLADIQGLILWGYGHMPEARYLLFRVTAPSDELLRWIGALPLNSAAADTLDVLVDEPSEPLVNIAFSQRGLLALGLSEQLCSRFSTAFCADSHHPYRTLVNGDVGPSAPEHWSWGSRENPVHVVLLVYARTKPGVEEHARTFIEQARARGLALVAALEGTTLGGRKEHFGFRDGIAQPTIQGSGRAELAGNTVAAGEFLLGHRDGYGNVTHSPVSPRGHNFGLNGSYLVLRQLEQDVDGFWRYCEAKAKSDPILLASKMVGRWPSGAPLVRHPWSDPAQGRFSDEDNFSYVANDEDNDRYGARCPFGSHVRRANPRDWGLAGSREESLRLANLHRIMRRGRPYGEPLYRDSAVPDVIADAAGKGKARPAVDAAALGSVRRGLSFLCFNANIERQFEFIQQQWCNNPKFAGLANDPDPLLGAARSAAEWGVDGVGFTLQSDARTGAEARCDALQHFVKVVGSGYFFMPSIPAVRLMGAGLLGAGLLGGGASPIPGGLPLESPPPDEQLAIDRLIADLRGKLMRDYASGKTLRDGHPKMHGLLRAVFRVEPDLPPQLAIGLFAQPKEYNAWVRVSNESGSVEHDRQPDVRGLAIKLMGVDGFKLLDGQESSPTQDFILTTREGFVTKDAAEFSELIHALVQGPAALVGFMLTHPRVALALLRARKRHSDLLAARYFSGVPYLLGTSAVKYSLVPVGGAPSAAADTEHHDFLREVLKARLAQQSARFDFAVQIHPQPSPRDIEDSRAPWQEADMPFHKVATLEILQQDFDTPERQEFGENLSFNPWRCLPEHRPLGGINRARRQVYPALSATRHGRNAAPAVEPG
jgi:Dyp-type peroxidase family